MATVGVKGLTDRGVSHQTQFFPGNNEHVPWHIAPMERIVILALQYKVSD